MRNSKTMTAILSGATLLCIGSALRADDDRLRRIIENVRANESIYENIEAQVTQSYELGREGVTSMPAYVWKSATIKRRTVLQGQFIYFRRDATVQLVDNSTPPGDCVMGYDGEYTRRLEGKSANLVRGPSQHCQLFRPHAWLLDKAFVCFPLSIWLAGGRELQNHPAAGQWKENWLLQAFYEKDELLDGLNTVKLRTEAKDPSGKPIMVRFLWLATDRNYLPVKTEAFGPQWSKTLPLEVCRATDFREVAPGVWLPFHSSAVVYDNLKAADNKHVASNTEESTVTKVDLNPHYDISLFREIPIPDGTRVYELKDGNIIDEYIQGERTSPDGERTSPDWQPPKSSRRWRLLLVPIAGLVLMGGWGAYRLLRSRRAATGTKT